VLPPESGQIADGEIELAKPQGFFHLSYQHLPDFQLRLRRDLLRCSLTNVTRPLA